MNCCWFEHRILRHIGAILILGLYYGPASVAFAQSKDAREETTRTELEQLPTTGPVTAAQVGSGVYWKPELNETSITQVIADLERWQLRNLYVECFANCRTIFPSSQFEQADPAGRDWLQYICTEAAPHHVRVFAWVHTLQWYRRTEGDTTPSLLLEHPDWSEVTRNGDICTANEPSIFVSPAVREVQDRLVGLMDELCSRSIDGVDLDDARYNADDDFGYSASAVQAFQAATEIDPLKIKQDTGRSSDWMKWVNYREDLVTSLVRELSFKARQCALTQNRRLLISASYLPGYTSSRGKNTRYQNWPEWVERRFLDLSNPLCFSPSISGLEKELREVRSVHQSTAVACVPVLALGKLRDQHPAYADQRKVLEGVGFRHAMLYRYETLRTEMEPEPAK